MNAAMRAEDDDIDSRDKPCSCKLAVKTIQDAAGCAKFSRQEDCPRHGIAASNARENRYWQRVGRD